MDPLERPIFVVGTPQSGSSYVYSALAKLPGILGIGAYSRDAFGVADELRPARRGHDSNRRTEADVTPKAAERIRAELLRITATEAADAAPGRLIDGAPRHALRIPFLDAVFPDARFVYVYRSPRDTIASMIEAWRSGAYVTHPDLPGWPGPPWSLLLIPGWRELAGKSLAEIATTQWIKTTRIMLDDLLGIAPGRWAVVDEAALQRDPGPELERIAQMLGLQWDPDAAAGSPAGHVEQPTPARMAQIEEELQRLLPRTIGLAEAAHDLLAAPVSRRPTATPDFEAATRSVHTGSFARLLDRLDSSLLLTTGTTGKLVCVRHDGTRVNTHFDDLPQAGALAVSPDEFVVLGAETLHRYRRDRGDTASTSPRFRPYARERAGAATAIAIAAGVLWVAQGEELAPFDPAGAESPVKPWRLPFAGDAAEARWHLTGIAVDSGGPAYVCAVPLAAESRPGEPRRGCLVDCASGEVIADGLADPRAPRLHEGRILVLERELDKLSAIDPPSGERTEVTGLPGSPAGLAVAGNVAFAALSRIRGPGAAAPEPAAGERFSGVLVVDLTRGDRGGYLSFEGELAEVRDIALLGYRNPEIGPAG